MYPSLIGVGRCHALACVRRRTPSLLENRLQRDNTTLCPWEVVKIPGDVPPPFPLPRAGGRRRIRLPAHTHARARASERVRDGEARVQNGKSGATKLPLDFAVPVPSFRTYTEDRSIHLLATVDGYRVNKRTPVINFWCVHGVQVRVPGAGRIIRE